MKKFYALALVSFSLVFMIFSIPVNASNRAGLAKFTVGGGYDYLSAKRNMHNAGGPMVILGYNFTDRWGMEAMAAWFNTTFKPSVQDNRKVNGTLFSLDGIYHFCPLWHQLLQPFVLAGAGVVGLNPNRNDANNEGNMNAGLGLEVFVHRSIALRADARDFYTLVGGKNDIFLDAGLTFMLDI